MTRRNKEPLVCVLRVTLTGVEPPIWRRLAVPLHISLEDLSLALQKTVGWSNVHLHEFHAGKNIYGMEDVEEEMEPGVLDERKFRLCDIAPEQGAAFTYLYDPADQWLHDVVVEEIVPPEQRATAPLCLDGARACPPEDCGGPEGYEHFLQAMEDPSHPDHEEMAAWVEGVCDPEDFDLEYVNDILSR